MCYFSVTRMACGHQEVSTIAFCCPTEANNTPLYILPEEIADNEPHRCNKICGFSGDLGSQESEVRSGEMCGPCQVAIGQILDDQVRNVDRAGISGDQQCTMSGGLDADTYDIFPKNILDDLARDFAEATASKGPNYMMSDEQYPGMVNIYPERRLNDFAHGSGGYPTSDITLDMYTTFDGFTQEESRRTYEDTTIEWLSRSDTCKEAAAEYQFENESSPSLSKPGSPMGTTECSSCKRFKLKGTLFNFFQFPGRQVSIGDV